MEESLRIKVTGYKERLRARENEVGRLRAALQAFVDVEDQPRDESDDDEPILKPVAKATINGKEANDGADEQEVENAIQDGSEDETSPEAFWDSESSVWRCGECNWEIVDDLCQGCMNVYDNTWEDGDPAEAENSMRVAVTDYHMICPARRLEPRGTTPVREIPSAHLAYTPALYANRVEEYRQLLARGATPAMCKTFKLEFTYEEGIVATADDALLEEFEGRQMEETDVWKIYLGRELTLDKADDDGSIFMVELVEEAVIWDFPKFRSKDTRSRWETIQEVDQPGIWITRPEDPAKEKEAEDLYCGEDDEKSDYDSEADVASDDDEYDDADDENNDENNDGDGDVDLDGPWGYTGFRNHYDYMDDLPEDEGMDTDHSDTPLCWAIDTHVVDGEFHADSGSSTDETDSDIDMQISNESESGSDDDS